jgi:hypothetical protein
MRRDVDVGRRSQIEPSRTASRGFRQADCRIKTFYL